MQIHSQVTCSIVQVTVHFAEDASQKLNFQVCKFVIVAVEDGDSRSERTRTSIERK